MRLWPFGTRKVKDIEAVYSGAVVLPGDRARGLFASHGMNAVLAERDVGYVSSLVNINASACARQFPRVYRKAAGRGAFTLRGRRVPLEMKRRLASGRYGKRAAEMAGGVGDLVEVMDHPIVRLLERPEPGVSGPQWREAKFRALELTGSAYDVVGGSGASVTLTDAVPQWMHAIVGDDGLVGWSFGRGYNREQLRPEDVLHYRYRLNPNDPWRGLSWLEQHLLQAEMVSDADENGALKVRRGNVAASLLSPEPNAKTPPSAKDLEELQALLQQHQRNKFNRVSTIVTSAAVRKIPLADEARSAQATRDDEVERARADLRIAAGVPESMLYLNDANLASSTQGYSVQYLEVTVWPRLVLFGEMLSLYLPPLFGEDPDDWFVVFDDPTPGNEQDAVSLSASRLAAGLTTIAQEQAELGLDVSDDPEAKVLRINGTPLDQAGQVDAGLGLFSGFGRPAPQPQASTPEPDQSQDTPQVEGVERQEAMTAAMATVLADLVKQVASGELPAESAIEIASAAVPTLSRERLAKMFGVNVSQAPQEAPPASALPNEPAVVEQAKDEARSIDIRGIVAARDPWSVLCASCGTRSVDPQYESDDLIRSVLERMRGTVSVFLTGRVQAWVQAVLSGETPPAIGPELAAELAPLYAEAFLAGYESPPAADRLDPFNLPQPDALQAVSDDLIRLSQDLDDATRDMVQAVTRNAIENGLSIQEVQSELVDVVASEARAERIARTEIQYAANKGSYQRYSDAGVEQVDWITAPGATAVHRAIAARSPMPIGQPFARAGETITAAGESETYTRDVFYPPARPNCRCTIVPRIG